MTLRIPAAEVEQPPERERQACRLLGWPAIGWLPDDMERVRRLQVVPYPLPPQSEVDRG